MCGERLLDPTSGKLLRDPTTGAVLLNPCGPCNAAPSFPYTRTFVFSDVSPFTCCAGEGTHAATSIYIPKEVQAVAVFPGILNWPSFGGPTEMVASYLDASGCSKCPSGALGSQLNPGATMVEFGSTGYLALENASGGYSFYATVPIDSNQVPVVGTYPTSISGSVPMCGSGATVTIGDTAPYVYPPSLPTSLTVTSSFDFYYCSAGTINISATSSAPTFTYDPSERGGEYAFGVSYGFVVGSTGYSGTVGFGASNNVENNGSGAGAFCNWMIYVFSECYFSPTMLGTYVSRDPSNPNTFTVTA